MKPPHLSPFQEAGGLVYISGQLPFDADGKISGAGVAEQTTQVLQNIDRVLGSIGLERSNIVKTTVWLRPDADFTAFNDSYAAFFGEHRPARSTVLSGLVLAAATVEIEAIACR
ncbi:RidA family protein [Nitrospirillum iridis]|uniref:2-iminobutanoate/2-iminopropanoate deaminase n=1 Tax=Nitrospirillum iridis TaxID=765888 RepID=A0A7X0AYL2_9PROT|nr:RidA family protein [Nitrospirillum iridis]MBB6252137.1 2-iminobutanoate/2-iminopropanoate deaminase [Nitrospirillum iridis]